MDSVIKLTISNDKLDKDEKKQDGDLQLPSRHIAKHIKYFLLATAFLAAFKLFTVSDIHDYDIASIKEEASELEDLQIEVTSGPNHVSFSVNGDQLVTRTENGLHIVILDQSNGRLLINRTFDKSVTLMTEFMEKIPDGRIILLAVKINNGGQLDWGKKLYLKGMGSLHAEFLTAADQWAMVAQPGVAVPVLGEMVTKGSNSSSEPVQLSVTMPRMFDKPGSKNTCDMLLDDGSYDIELRDWKPKGCTMHRYTRSEAELCFKKVKDDGFNNSIVFLGDSRLRYVFQNMKTFLSSIEIDIPHGVNASYGNTDDAVDMNYYWSPFVDKSFIEYFNQWENSTTPPRMIVASNTLWHMFVVSKDIINTREDDFGFQNYTTALEELVEVVQRLTSRGSKVYWPIQEPIFYEQVYNTKWRKDNPDRMTNGRIDMYNAATIEILQGSGAQIWRSYRLMGKKNMHELHDGLHHSNTARNNQFQVLLNSYCNEHMSFNEDNICCAERSNKHLDHITQPIRTIWRHNNMPISTTVFHELTLATLATCCVVAVGVLLVRLSQWVHDRTHQGDSDYTVVTSLAKMAVIMAFFCLCAMTDLFTKQQKHFSEYHFWLPLCGLLALGVFFNKKCPDEKLLNRDLTDEWKDLAHPLGESDIFHTSLEPARSCRSTCTSEPSCLPTCSSQDTDTSVTSGKTDKSPCPDTYRSCFVSNPPQSCSVDLWTNY